MVTKRTLTLELGAETCSFERRINGVSQYAQNNIFMFIKSLFIFINNLKLNL